MDRLPAIWAPALPPPASVQPALVLQALAPASSLQLLFFSPAPARPSAPLPQSPSTEPWPKRYLPLVRTIQLSSTRWQHQSSFSPRLAHQHPPAPQPPPPDLHRQQ